MLTLIDDLKPPAILHSYIPAKAGVKVKKLRPRDLESILELHTLPSLLQPGTRLCVTSECHMGLLILSSHLRQVTKTPLLPIRLYKIVSLSGWLSISNSIPSHLPSTADIKPKQVLNITMQ